jgi:hypothetical protein
MYAFFAALWSTAFFEFMFRCRPMAAAWDLRVVAASKGGHCISGPFSAVFFSVIYALTDIFLLMLPISVVSKLPLQSSRKFGVVLLFSLGSLSCVFCIWKASYVRVAIHTADPGCKYRNPNPLFHILLENYWCSESDCDY